MASYSVGPAPAAGVRRLHLNEYRFDHPLEVVATAACQPEMACKTLSHYQSGPDPELAADLARYVGAPDANHVLVAAGSDEVLRAIIDTSHLRGHTRVIMGVPGYAHFSHYCRLRQLTMIEYAIGLQTTPADHEASLRYYDDDLTRGALVYLCSPNNPTGDLWSAATVGRLARDYPASLFLIDEAYIEFAGFNDGTGGIGAAGALNEKSAVEVAIMYTNVVVARTMSKAFGLAALRIGYAVGTPELIAQIATAASPKAMNPLAAPVAREVLRHLDRYLTNARAARREAGVVVAALRKSGWWCLDTPGNYYLVYAGDAGKVTADLLRAGIAARNRDDMPGLAGFIRLTAGTMEDTDAVLAAFETLTPPATLPPQTLYTRKGVVAEVKRLLKLTMAVLNAAGVEVWAQSGTMLGMARHGGMIPTDDDGDLGYLRTPECDPVAMLTDQFAAQGLTLQRNRTDAYHQVGTNAPGTVISPVHIDIFSYGRHGDYYVLDDPRYANEEPDSPNAECNTRYTHGELYPLNHDHHFYDIPVPMPAQSEKVLLRALGADCMRVMRVRTPSGIVAVNLRDYTPA